MTEANERSPLPNSLLNIWRSPDFYWRSEGIIFFWRSPDDPNADRRRGNRTCSDWAYQNRATFETLFAPFNPLGHFN
ncbi:hypothetical protein JJD41_09540 [Oxynema sp. CENA135]|uniref:hypothetical protein n=1 Tax=Oxynema sp. CENA135 TaxID=984206 RepID=UPI001909BB20|nr:hypothetical protein [Oxynema sp. CENA135]MBK4730097.1 hypothetical protein [Oxynema sp. CENA135]